MGRIVPQDTESEPRSGHVPWHADPPPRTSLTRDLSTDVVVVGGGVTGSLVAEALNRDRRSVVVVDRAVPGRVSTAASTAMLMWEIDTPLVELADRIGFDRASAVYRRSLAAVSDLATTTRLFCVACDLGPRASLQLAGERGDLPLLTEERRLRARAGLPGELLDEEMLLRRFRMARPGALLSPRDAECDPLALAGGMLAIAVRRGARTIADEVLGFERRGELVEVELAGGRTIRARDVVLATGYAMPDVLPAQGHRLVSTWCFATAPRRVEELWPERVLLWETGTPYLYARTTVDGRIVCGGEDRPTRDAADREAATADRLTRLTARFAALWPAADLTPSHVWSAEFGETNDGLPLIGPVPGRPGLWAAYGYGGNGITFSHMAARIIAARLRGEHRPWFDEFAIDRDLG